MSKELTKPGINQITLKINPPVEVVGGVEVVRDDLSLVKVWMSETAGFTPSEGNLVYSGKELQTTITQLKDGTPLEVGTPQSPKEYYLKYALISSIDPSVEDVLTLADAVAPLNTDLVTIDFTNPPNIVSLSAAAGYSLITVTWTAPSYTNAGGHNYTRIYALKRTGTEAVKPYNDPSAIQFDVYNTNTFVHSVELGETWYYYAVYVGKNGLSSATPVGPTAFVSSALDVSYVLGELTGQISSSQLVQDILTPIASRDKVFEDTFELETSANWVDADGSRPEITIESVSDAYTGGKVLRVGNNSGNDQAWLIHSTRIPYNPDTYYRFEVTIREVIGDGTIYLGFAGFDADGNYVNISGADTYSSQHYFIKSALNLTDSDWHTYSAILKGYGSPNGSYGSGTIENPAVAHENVKYIAPLVLVNYNGKPGTVELDSFKIYDETYAATSRIELNQTTDELGSRYTVRVDNAGYVAGFGLASENTNLYDGTSAVQSTFGINASTFYVAPQGYASDTEPAGPGIPDGFTWIDTSGETNVIKYWNDADSQWETSPLTYPFIVKTAPFTLGTTQYPPGVYMDSAYIVDLNADNITAGTLSADRVDARSLTIGYDQIDGDDKPENGATRNVFVGSWASGVEYSVGDVVIDDIGYGWSCIQAHTSGTITTPQYPNTNAYWQVYTVKGDPGQSITGPQGTRGTVQIVATGTSWSDSTANSAIETFTGSPDNSSGEYNVRGDQVTISGGTFSQTKYWDGTAWLNRDAYINGNLLVDGTITADQLSTNELITSSAQIKDAVISSAKIGQYIASSNYNGIIDGNGNIDVSNIGTDGWAVSKDGTAVFKDVYTTNIIASGTAYPGLANRVSISTTASELSPVYIYINTGVQFPVLALYEKSISCRIGSIKYYQVSSIPSPGTKLADITFDVKPQFKDVGFYYQFVPEGIGVVPWIVMRITALNSHISGAYNWSLYDIQWTLDDIG